MRIGDRLHPFQVPRIFKSMARAAGLPDAVDEGLSGRSTRVGIVTAPPSTDSAFSKGA